MLGNPAESLDSDLEESAFDLEDRRKSKSEGGPLSLRSVSRERAPRPREKRRGSAVSGSLGESDRRIRWRPASKLSILFFSVRSISPSRRLSSAKMWVLFCKPESSEGAWNHGPSEAAFEGRHT
jgi:hypothetical protein